MFKNKSGTISSEKGAALLIALAFLILIAWAAFLYGFNTLVSDSDVVQLDALCQTISKSALNEFPHPLGGFKGLNEYPTASDDSGGGDASLIFITKGTTPKVLGHPNPYEMLYRDINMRIQSTFALMGMNSPAPTFAFWEYLTNPALHGEDFWGGIVDGQIVYAFAPINTRSATKHDGQWNNGIKIRLAKIHKPWGTTFENVIPHTTIYEPHEIAQVQCEAVIRPIDVLLVEDTSAAQSRWTKAGDGGDLQRLCTEEGMRYEDYRINKDGTLQSATQLGYGGPKLKRLDLGNGNWTLNPDVYSLCWRVCVANATGGPPLDATGNYINDYMLLAGPAGKQAWECPAGSPYGAVYGDDASETETPPPTGSNCVKPIAIEDTGTTTQVPVSEVVARKGTAKLGMTNTARAATDPLRYPYFGQRVVCQTAHSNPAKSHIMLTSAAEGQSKYCAHDPLDGNATGHKYGYHPLCWDTTSFMGECADSETGNGVECKAATSPTGATHVVPAASDMLVTERGVTDYITKGLTAADDPNLTGGPNNARWAVATLGGNEDLPSGAIALEYQADALYNATGAGNLASKHNDIRLRHYYAYTNFLNALNSMMDARQCVNDYMLKLKLSTLAGVNFIEGGDPGCEIGSDDNCYKTEWKPSGTEMSGAFTTRQNWSSSLYRLAIMHYSDIARFSNGDPRFPDNFSPLFESVLSHGIKYMRALDKDAMTRKVVQQNVGYGCEGWVRKNSFKNNVPMWPVDDKAATPISGGVQLPFVPQSAHDFDVTANRDSKYEAPTPPDSIKSPQTVLKYQTDIGTTANIVTVNDISGTALPPKGVIHSLASLTALTNLMTEPHDAAHKADGSPYDAPVPGFFRVGPPVDPSQPASKTNFVLGWNASGRRYTFSALKLAVIALEPGNRIGLDAVAMGPTSSPEKLLVFNASGPPSDLECLHNQLGPTIDFSQPNDPTSAAEKKHACWQCWDEVRMRLECDWDGQRAITANDGTVTGCTTNDPPDYNGRIALYLNILGDKNTENLANDEYCGGFNLAWQAHQDSIKTVDGTATGKPLRPWLHVNVLKSLDDMVNASNVYLFAREFLRSK